MKNLYLLGATGSIGRQTLEIVDAFPNQFNVVSLTARKRIDDLIQLIEKYNPKFVSVDSKEVADDLTDRYPDIVFGYGPTSLIHAATFNPKDSEALLVNALVGISGLAPTVEAINIGRKILLANKETLVVGGDLVMKLAKEKNVEILPIDSEHSAVLQSLKSGTHDEIDKIILTASGGPFRNKSVEDLKSVTKADALNHPNWKMGDKITIDSATMMNKGFEVIEAMHLFDVPLSKIEVILHPESIIHSMVSFKDASIIAQLSNHDMKLPIEYALFHPVRNEKVVEPLNLHEIATLNFKAVDETKYPCFTLAKEAIQTGGSMPCVLNAANEAAVDLFLNEMISFTDIAKIVEEEMKNHVPIDQPTLQELLEIDRHVKQSIYNRTRHQN